MGSGAKCSRLPSVPSIGRCPMSREVLAAMPSRISSSSCQQVPSKSRHAHPSSCSSTDAVNRCAPGTYTRARPVRPSVIRYPTTPSSPPRVEGGEGLDLGPDIGRSVEQEPSPVICAHRHGRLLERATGPRAVPHGPALGTVAVPLRKPTSGRGSEHTGPHTHPPSDSIVPLAAPRRDGHGAGAGPNG